MKWTSNSPSVPGFYWCYQYGKTRMVSVWKYNSGNDKRIFTNEDGATPITDREIYGAAKWCGPIEPPTPPSNVELTGSGAATPVKENAAVPLSG